MFWPNCARDGVSREDVDRAATRLVADAVYAQDNQTSLARWFGAALANGGTVEDVLGWSARIEAVTVGRRRQGREMAAEAPRRQRLPAQGRSRRVTVTRKFAS